jgi:predicted PurR-regulated permease PerM
MLTKVKSLIPGAVLLLPAIALAQRVGSIEDLLGLFLRLLNNYIVPLIVAIAVVYFMWGVVQFVTAGGDEEKRTTGRNTMIYGIVAIFVILSVWGLVNILNGTFGTANQSNPQQLPNLPQPR